MGQRMNIAIRADASEIIGAGHVMRCLTLAEALKIQNAQLVFICQELPGHLCDFIEAKGYPVYRLPSGQKKHPLNKSIDWQYDAENTKSILTGIDGEIEWLIVDHYELDNKWELEVAGCAKQIMVIDDLANRKHQCNILLDQNYSSPLNDAANKRYVELVPEYCKVLLGPKYALLRDEFLNYKNKTGPKKVQAKRVLISLGGSDVYNVTSKIIDALGGMNTEVLEVDVVVGQSNPLCAEIERKCAVFEGFNFYCQTSNMASLIANSDMVIGAGGTSTWERCYLGVPSLVITIADNQIRSTEALAKDGYVLYLADQTKVNIKNLQSAINCIFK